MIRLRITAAHARKAALPYFGAMMSVDAQEAAQKAGFSDEQAFLLGVGIGAANTFLERLQFGIRQKNPFLAEKVFGVLNKRKDYTKAVMMQHFVNGVKNRIKHFGRGVSCRELAKRRAGIWAFGRHRA